MHGSHGHKSLYYFRVFTNGVQHHESDGLDFEERQEVWQEGAQSACEILYSMHGRIDDNLDWRLDVSDESSKVIFRFSFKAERF